MGQVKVKMDHPSVESTALLTLGIRIMDFNRKEPILSDTAARSIAERLDFDFDSLKIPDMTVITSLIRMSYIDTKARDFILQRPEPRIVITLGAGLDTRYERIGCPEDVAWFDVDLPEVMALRKTLFEETEQRRFIASSLFDFRWLDRIHAPKPASILVIAEGIFLYCEKDDVRNLFIRMKEKLNRYEIVFDVASPFFAAFSRINPRLRKLHPHFKWGLAKTKDLCAWFEGIALLDEFRFFNGEWKEAGAYNLCRFLPFINNASRVAHICVR
jgi:O-methyltransferase involved in polyketide biosynthesis